MDKRLFSVGVFSFMLVIVLVVYILRVSGKGTWYSNPYVFAYEFKLVR